MTDMEMFKAKFYMGVQPLRPAIAIQYVSRVKDVDPLRRRGYIRRLQRDRVYQNASRRTKTLLRSLVMMMEVPRD